ncbi:GntR family transcriptional regulator [Mycetocola miduiensis]|uniref:Transcriptional regulator, GntR family n=1 Tax=Mycetocola miduiensis TaxID=995034 RepID=A0A1I4YMD4_9MICO|nr:GntR family transcriptional regulator [Mycetocola miduiensis]SFN39156.1 transcriptional regulator, GntR family [Mycetocola miduiensis]
MTVDSARRHKYEIVAAGIRAMITDSLQPNDALPSERELMEIHGVSRMTVRAAIARLADEGLLYNVHGSGTYVGSPNLFAKAPKLTSFTEDMVSRGHVPSSRVLEISRTDASSKTASRLRLSPGAECTRIRRLRLADGNPMAIETVYLPGDVLPIEDFDARVSLYVQLSERGYEIYRAEQEIQAAILDAESSTLLGVPAGSAALEIDRIATDRRGLPIEYARTIYRGDRYSFQMAVTRESGDK